jgi:hypothetical protein
MDNLIKINNSVKKVIFLLNAKQDGGGDFGFGAKLIKKLKSIGILPKNMFVVLNFNNDFYKKFTDLNLNFRTNCEGTPRINLDEFLLNEEEIGNLRVMLNSICSDYKLLYNINDTDTNFCYSDPLPTSGITTYTKSSKNEHRTADNIDSRIKIILNNLKTEGNCTVNKDFITQFYSNFTTNRLFKIWVINTIKTFLVTDLSDSSLCEMIYIHSSN